MAMMRTLLLTLSSCLLLAAVPTTMAFVVNGHGVSSQRSTSTLLQASNKPLASQGDWTAYLDEDNTGFVYYFNGETGESLWEKPTPDFPDVKLVGSTRRKASVKQAEYLETVQSERKGFFQSMLEKGAEQPQVTQQQQKDTNNNDWFGGIFEDTKEKQKTEEKGFLSGMFSKSETTTVEEKKPAVQEQAAVVVEETKEKQDLFGGMFGKKEQQQQQTAVTEQQPQSVESTTTPAKIETASYVLPHPAKARWGGEDAVFVKGRTFGVFDGVSGAEKRDGIPLYSKTLAEEMIKQVPDDGMSMQELTTSMQKCAEIADQRATGASTAIVGSITEDGYLRALNLGDSACVVIRDNQVLTKTREISHYFDCPYQLSVDSPDRPRDGTKLNIELNKGDLILMASDGIFDNLTDDQLVEITQMEPQISKLAKRVSEFSRKVSLDQTAATPYARQAKKFGDPDFADGLGGKVDDVSCVVVSYQ